MTVFLTTLKRIFKQPLNWAFLLIFPFICFILLSITENSDNPDDVSATPMRFGIVDNDGSVLSGVLANQLGLRYNIDEVEQEDISAVLIDQFVPWVLVIGEGFENDVLAKKTELTTLESYSLMLTDVSMLAAVTAENITRALMILGTNDEAALEAWAEASQVEIAVADIGDKWRTLAQWISMFGFISIFTAYFVIKTLLDDKLRGMPDRVGVLPLLSRNYLLQGTFAAFLATEMTVILILAVLWLVLGTIPNVLLMFVLLSLFNLFSVSLILSITSIAKSLAAASVTMTMIATLSGMLGGLFWPLEMVPEFMQKVAWFTPGYWFGQGLQNIREPNFENFAVPLLFLFGFTVVTLLIGGLKKVQKMEDGD
ncbi:MAG: ABC transporter permease [Oscillospiraceae bacterium]|nr:ABC transporter permease [Oscillospiraceae bacterium]